MAMENKRITQLSTERLTLTSGDYVMVDDADNGSAKYRLDRLKETDNTLSVSGKAADAAATGQAISDEAEARENADNALGNDVRDLLSAISMDKNLLDEDFGDVVPFFEIGTIAFSSTTISYQSSKKGVRTPIDKPIKVSAGDKVMLTDYTGVHFKVAVLENDDTYTYIPYRQSDYTIPRDGLLYVVIQKTAEEEETDTYTLGHLCRVRHINGLYNSLTKMVSVGCVEKPMYTGQIEAISEILGKVAGSDFIPLEHDGYSFSSSVTPLTSIKPQCIRSSPNMPISIHIGDVVGLTDYTNYKWRYCNCRTDGSGRNEYVSDYTVNDLNAEYNGLLYVEISKSDESEFTDADLIAAQNIVYVRRKTKATLSDVRNSAVSQRQYLSILETGKMLPCDFQVGEVFGLTSLPTFRQYRCSSKYPFYAYGDYTIIADPGYRFTIYTINSDGTYTSSGWQTSYSINAGTVFSLLIAKAIAYEDATSIADIDLFVSKLTTSTPRTETIDEISETDISADILNAISVHMSRLYTSNVCDEYVFFTDPHLMGINGTFDENTFKRYINTIAIAVYRTSCEFVICGGDWLNSGDTKAQASVKLGFVDGQMRKYFGERYKPIVGNHDYNYLGVDGDGNRLPSSEWVSEEAMHNYWFHDYDNNYYSFKTQNTTYYILDTRQDYNGTNTYDKAMLDWLATSLIDDDPSHSTIAMHIYRLLGPESEIPTRISAVGAIISAFNSHSICTLTVEEHEYSKTYDFTECTGKIDYCIAGHSHSDFIQTLGGVPIICTVNAQEDGTPSFDLVFVDYTGNKIYLTRIGSGSSREVSLS